jgi:hypothetical protein
MARAECVKTVSVVAGAAVDIYRFVQLQADGKFDKVGTAQARMDGVAAQEADADGDVIAMALPQGIMKVEAGAAVSVGDVIASDNAGRAITSVDAGGNFACGVALTAATAAGEIIEVLMTGVYERDA